MHKKYHRHASLLKVIKQIPLKQQEQDKIKKQQSQQYPHSL